MRKRLAILTLWALASPASVPAAPAADDAGFEVLLDAGPADGWKQAGPGGFRVENGVATPFGGMGLWWHGKKKYKDFILKLEFRQDRPHANSGVYVRFPDPGDDPWVGVHQGYEVQIAGDQPSKNSTAAIYDFQAPDSVPLKPAGEWNEYEITAVSHRYFVHLNGALVNAFTGNRNVEGFVGVQNHDDKSIVQYRNIRIKELPDRADNYHVLFDGRDMKGWRMAGPGSFEVRDGALVSRGGMGLLWHERVCGDFLLLFDWRVKRREDNSGVFVRFPPPGDDPWVAVNQGYEVQICDSAAAKERTGSIYSFQDASAVPTRPVGEWNHGEILVQKQRYTVSVNGVKVNEFEGERGLKGHLGFQNHDPGSEVSFRHVRVVVFNE